MPVTFLRHVPIDPGALPGRIAATRSELGEASARGDPHQVLEHAGMLVGMLTAAGREAEAYALGLEHVASARSHATLEASAWLIHGLATAAQYCDQRSQADALFAEALESARRHGWRRLEHFVLHHRGRCQVEEGKLDAAERCFIESRAIRREIDADLVASSERALSELARRRLEGGNAKIERSN